MPTAASSLLVVSRALRTNPHSGQPADIRRKLRVPALLADKLTDRAAVPIPVRGTRDCKDYSDTRGPVSANSVTEQGERNLLWPLQSAAAGEKIGGAGTENET